MSATTPPVLAWHFLADSGLLRDGRTPPADGKRLLHRGDLELCKTGLHASIRPLDALQYAPGSIVCRVKCGGRIEHADDKLVCSCRTILWRADATEALRKFARRCALDVIDKWDAPDVVREYLETGDESKRAAARAAATAARPAAWAVAWAVAWDAARAAATAARPATRAASRAAARDKYNGWLAEELLALEVKP